MLVIHSFFNLHKFLSEILAFLHSFIQMYLSELFPSKEARILIGILHFHLLEIIMLKQNLINSLEHVGELFM